jgi:hypothetical protein
MGLIRGYPSERRVARRQRYRVAVYRRANTSAARGDCSENSCQVTTDRGHYSAVAGDGRFCKVATANDLPSGERQDDVVRSGVEALELLGMALAHLNDAEARAEVSPRVPLLVAILDKLALALRE